MKFFSSLAQSLHSPFFYQRVFREEQRGIGFAYLAKLLFFCWLVVAVVLMVLVLEARRNPEENALMLPVQLLRKVSPQFPPLKIVNGRVILVGDQPFTIYDPETGLPLMIIDTSGQTPNLHGTEAQVLLSRTAVSFSYEGEEVVYDLPPELDTEITGAKLEEWADMLERSMPYAPFIMLPFNVIASLIGFAGRWLLMGGIADIALKSRIEETNVSSVLRVSAYALTGPILLKMLMIGSGFQPFGSPEILIFGLGILYLFFAVSSILKTAK